MLTISKSNLHTKLRPRLPTSRVSPKAKHLPFMWRELKCLLARSLTLPGMNPLPTANSLLPSTPRPLVKTSTPITNLRATTRIRKHPWAGDLVAHTERKNWPPLFTTRLLRPTTHNNRLQLLHSQARSILLKTKVMRTPTHLLVPTLLISNSPSNTKATILLKHLRCPQAQPLLRPRA